ncbi:adhesion G-protein coupled receptor D1-like [Thalassophryne amazonica]|uniref:adhesion G-protein coupled receptor D1-like n=1 Tax=Thalassophryne amazonica TaxID=390379 RepID=UPI001471A873|nr:adhesion G-protein coupled receptor D1-like [Thalassophryne amazonica]
MLPNKTIPHNTANNLTQAFLQSVDEVLSSPGLVEAAPVASGLIRTVEDMMEHMVTKLEPSPNGIISLGGRSPVADYTLMKLPRNHNLQHYRFPTQGKNYISVPREAFHVQSEKRRRKYTFYHFKMMNHIK